MAQLTRSEKLQIFYEVLAKTNLLEIAQTSASISNSELKDYKKDIPEFEELIQKARLEYRENTLKLCDDWDLDAIAYVNSLLKGKAKRCKTVTRYEGFEGSELVAVEQTVTEETLAPPKWILESLIPRQKDDTITVNVNFNDNLNETEQQKLIDEERQSIEEL